MDVKYSYYNTSKGYRVTGGTAAHFLKADGSLDNAVYTTVNQADSKYVPFNGSPFNINLNTKNINNAGIVESTALKNNSSTLQVKSFVLQNQTTVNSVGIKLTTAGTSNMMGSFTITLFGYPGNSVSFRVSMYKYLYNWYIPRITWLHGSSTFISNIEFYKEDDSNLHLKINFLSSFGPYNKTVITDVLAIDSDPLHNPDTYTITVNPDNSTHTLQQTTSNTQFIRDHITAGTNQVGLSGDKTTTGNWIFNGTGSSSITLLRPGNTINNSIAMGFNAATHYLGLADANTFAIGNSPNLVLANRKLWVDFTTNAINASGQVGGSTVGSRDVGGFAISTTTNTSRAEMILRHNWSANNQTFGVGGISSGTSGSMSQWGMYKWLNDRTVNGNDGFFGWEGDTDTLKASSLAGTGTRMVVADSVGRLSAQIIPSVPTATQINNWNTAYNWGNHANAGYATTAQLGLYIPLSQRGAANGVATLDAAGLIPTTQLPSYVDDVIEGASLAVINALPANEKQTGKIYVTTDTNKSYRWSGSVFVEISSGAVQSVNGQTGVVNLTYSDVGASAVNHTHTIAQVTGLQSALDGKVDDSQVLTNVPAGAVFTDTIYTLPTATSTNKGGVEIFSDTVQTVASNAVTATASRTYGIQLNSAGQAVVNVPWVDTNTAYTAGNGLTLTGTAFSLPITVSGSGNYITDVAQNANGITVTKGNLPSYSLTVATSTSLGGIRLFSDVVNNMAPNSVTEIKGRSYAVQLNNNNQAVVNVPWTDNNIIYTSSNGIVLAGTNFTPTYGTTVNTVAQGNDSRINNGETAFGWGNHANAGYLTYSALSNYYTKNESLNLFVKSSGVETIADTKTFTHSPVIPNGTLGAHAVNKSQIELSTSSESEGGQQLYISGNNSVNLTNYFVTSRDGSRNPDDIAPNSTPRRVRFDFANSTSAGLGGSGNYAGIMTFAPWDGTTASTGDSSYQLAFANQSGSNGAGAPMLKLRKGIDDKWGKWTKFWTDADFTNLNIQQWNYASQYGLKLNEEFSINTGSRLMLADGFYGNESGMMDHTFERFVSGKQNEYYKYGSLYGNFDGLNFNVDTQLLGMGREANKDDKLTVEGSVKASKNFKSEDENPDTLFIPNGNLATLRDEIVNDQSDYAIRLDPHEYNIDPSGVLAVDDRNRLIHIIGEQVKMTVDFKRVYPKQQIVIYNFDQSGGTMAVKIQGKLIATLSARCFLRLYVTKSQRVIAERQQPCDFVW